MRIGLSSTARAEKLGVPKVTVKRWDETDRSVSNDTDPSSGPTHIRRGGGNPSPYPVKAPRANGVRANKGVGSRPKRPGPPWHRHFTIWCRAILPEDRQYLLAMSEELHKALGRLDLACGPQEEIK